MRRAAFCWQYHAQDAVSLAVPGNVHRGLRHHEKDLNNVPAAAEALLEIAHEAEADPSLWSALRTPHPSGGSTRRPRPRSEPPLARDERGLSPLPD